MSYYHFTVSEDTLYMRGHNRATVAIQRMALEDLARKGCEICGITVEDLARVAHRDLGPNEILLQVLPCEDTDLFAGQYGRVVDVHIVCSRCQRHPLVASEDLLGVTRCIGAFTEADRALVALGEM